MVAILRPLSNLSSQIPVSSNPVNIPTSILDTMRAYADWALDLHDKEDD